jgi:hypothetical protein
VRIPAVALPRTPPGSVCSYNMNSIRIRMVRPAARTSSLSHLSMFHNSSLLAAPLTQYPATLPVQKALKVKHHLHHRTLILTSKLNVVLKARSFP